MTNKTTIPSAPDLEKAVLGAIILEGGHIDKMISDFSPGLFYHENNKVIAESIIELYKQSRPIDMLTVVTQLKKTDKLQTAGGASYIAQLTSQIASSANLEYHLRILQENALRRNLISICSNTLSKALEDSEDIFDVYTHLIADADNSIKEIIHYDIQKVGDVHNEILRKAYEISDKGIKSGVTCGLRLVDNLTNGWQKSDLIILAGRPSMGKTAAAVSMIMHPALEVNVPVGIFSLEMSKEQLVSRMQSSMSGINVSNIVKKQLVYNDINKIAADCRRLETAPIYIDDTPNISLLELKGKARKLVKENNVQLIVIDYLQLMRSGKNIANREQEIADIIRGLKGLAKELSIPIIALSQLSRTVESRNDKKPMLSDLRESGQIEQDADMVVFCYRPEYYGIETYEVGSETFPAEGLFMLLIAKHRNGELGEIPLRFIHEQTKLTNLSFNLDNRDIDYTFVKQNTNGGSSSFQMNDAEPF